MTGLSDFMDAHASADPGYSRYVYRGTEPNRVRLADSGIASQEIARAARDPELAEQILASLFWWCFVRTSTFNDTTRGVGGSAVARQIIVGHAGGTRHDLLILESSIRETFTARISAETPYYYQSPQHDTISDVALAEGERMQAMLARAGIHVNERTAILAVNEVANFAHFQVVVAREPGESPTEAPARAEPATRVLVAPVPALPVTISGRPAPVATAGVIGLDGTGRTLVITARHALAMVAGSAEILVDGTSASVAGYHEVTDSCLLSVARAGGSDSGHSGFLRFAPQVHRPAAFDGAASGHKRTMIRGYDMSVLDPSPYLGSKVYTEPDTVPGDSGAALIDCEDHIVGFAVSRTALGAPLEFSTWSWAEQVLAAHGLA